MNKSTADPVMLRNCGFFKGNAWCTPHVLVQETPDLVVLFRPEGVLPQDWNIEHRELTTLPPTRMDMLRLMFPGRMYAIELFFDTGRGTRPYSIFEAPAMAMRRPRSRTGLSLGLAGGAGSAVFAHAGEFEGEGRFRGWKVNMEAAFRRTPIGFDTTDHFVDIVVKPDFDWYWKDEEEMREWRKKGGYEAGEIESFLAAGREAEEMIKRRLAPFDGSWNDWLPAPGQSLPEVPQGWEELPGVDITMSLNRRWDFWKVHGAE